MLFDNQGIKGTGNYTRTYVSLYVLTELIILCENVRLVRIASGET